MGAVKLITPELFDSVADRAAESPRRRMNYNFHESASENPHRFLNVLLRGTYVRPHRHSAPPKSETFIVLEGMVEAILFDDQGAVTARHVLGAEGPGGKVWGIDLPPGVWHTVLALSERAVCFEVKPGPWEPASDKEFASWAPAEGAAGVDEYYGSLCATL